MPFGCADRQLAESRNEFSEPGVCDIQCNVDNYQLNRASHSTPPPEPYDMLFLLDLGSTEPTSCQHWPVVVHHETDDSNIADTISSSAPSSELFAFCDRYPLSSKSSSEPFAFCDRDAPLAVPVGTRIGTPEKPSLNSIQNECDNQKKSRPHPPKTVHWAYSGSFRRDEHDPRKKSINAIVGHRYHGRHPFHHHERRHLGVRAYFRGFF